MEHDDGSHYVLTRLNDASRFLDNREPPRILRHLLPSSTYGTTAYSQHATSTSSYFG
jgi:hypothetical protein